MARSETVTITNMCMIYDNRGNVLVQDRCNQNWPGICFPGGHVEENEPFAVSVIREVKEETGLDIKNPLLCGIKQYCSDDGDRYIVLLYKTREFSGEIVSSDEGRVFWLPRSELEAQTLANRFEDMLKVFENDEISEVYYFKQDGKLETMFY